MAKNIDPMDYETMLAPTEENAKNEKLEMLNELVKQNYSKENIEVKTDINDKQIRAFGVARLFADKYKNILVFNLVEQFMTLSISKDRKSRKEYQEIAKSMLGSQTEIDNRPSMKERLFG